MPIGGSADVEDIAQASVRGLSPAPRCVTGNGGVLSIGESPRIPAPSGNHRCGEDWHGVNDSEPLLMPRHRNSPGRVVVPGRQGRAAVMRQAAAKDSAWLCGHRCPRGTEGARLQSCLMRAICGNPVRVRPAFGWSGKPTVRGAQFPGAEQDAQEANAGG